MAIKTPAEIFIHAAQFFSSTDGLHPELEGVFVSPAQVIATDGHAAIRVTGKTNLPTGHLKDVKKALALLSVGASIEALVDPAVKPPPFEHSLPKLGRVDQVAERTAASGFQSKFISKAMKAFEGLGKDNPVRFTFPEGDDTPMRLDMRTSDEEVYATVVIMPVIQRQNGVDYWFENQQTPPPWFT